MQDTAFHITNKILSTWDNRCFSNPNGLSEVDGLETREKEN